MDRNKRSIENLIGLATMLCSVVGLLALLVAIVSFFSADYTAASVGLIAAALGFGLFSLAILSS
jgi:uncharacterized membrane-anchored protein